MERRLERPNLYVTDLELTEIVVKYGKDSDSFSEQLLESSFHHIPISYVLKNTSKTYRSFLKEAGYGSIDKMDYLLVGKKLLRKDERIENIAKKQKIELVTNNNNVIVNINQEDSRKIVEALNYKLLTTGLMYKIVIPYLKKEDDKDGGAEETLKEMINSYAEWLEDKILDQKRLVIGKKEKEITLSKNDGHFSRIDLNKYGYPTNIKYDGEYYLWTTDKNLRAAFRSRNSDLCLNLYRKPGYVISKLGVRLAKFSH